MKLIKFDLPINGTKVKNLEELRDNLTDEILALARSSQLERWLRTRQMLVQADAVVKALKQEGTDKRLFLALCGVLEVEVHPDDVKAIFDASPKPGNPIFGARYSKLNENQDAYLNDKLECEKIIYLIKIKFDRNFIRNRCKMDGAQIFNLIGDKVVKVYVKNGDKVKKNDLILHVKDYESIFEIVSPETGVVKDVFVKKGQEIKLNQDLISIAESL